MPITIVRTKIAIQNLFFFMKLIKLDIKPTNKVADIICPELLFIKPLSLFISINNTAIKNMHARAMMPFI